MNENKYSKEETEKLISYYKNKIIDKVFDISFPFLVREIYSVKIDDKYSIKVRGYIAGRSHIKITLHLDSFINETNMIDIKEVLSNLNQD